MKGFSINPFLTGGLVYLIIWMSPFLVIGVPGKYFYLIVFCMEIPINK